METTKRKEEFMFLYSAVYEDKFLVYKRDIMTKFLSNIVENV